MKKSIAVLLLLFLSFSLFCQTKREPRPVFPRSFIDIGAGIGTNYGIIGGQTILGFKGSGVLLAAGFAPGGNIGYQIGLQGSYKWLFASVSYGTYNIVQDNSGTYTIDGIIIMGGGKVNLIKTKKLYLQIGIGYAGGGTVSTKAGPIDISGPTACIGIGYRIVFPKKEKAIN